MHPPHPPHITHVTLPRPWGRSSSLKVRRMHAPSTPSTHHTCHTAETVGEVFLIKGAPHACTLHTLHTSHMSHCRDRGGGLPHQRCAACTLHSPCTLHILHVTLPRLWEVSFLSKARCAFCPNAPHSSHCCRAYSVPSVAALTFCSVLLLWVMAS